MAHLQHPTSTPLTVITDAITPSAGGILQKRRTVLLAAAVLLLIAVGLSVGPFWSAVHKPSTDPRSFELLAGRVLLARKRRTGITPLARWHVPATV